MLLEASDPKKEPRSVWENSKHLPGFECERETGFEPATLSLGKSQGDHEPGRTLPQRPEIITNAIERDPHRESSSAPKRRDFAAILLLGKRGPREPFPSGFLSVREVAGVLKLSTATIYKLIHRGELAHFRVSNAVRIARADLERFIHQKKAGT